jgi:hypothetical protein
MATASASSLKSYLGGFRYDLTSEQTIQDGIAVALSRSGYEYEREARASAKDRFDFLVQGVAIEVKRHGAVNDLLRQLSRYAEHDEVRELLVVTARLQSTDLPSELHGKPLECLALLGSVF